MGAGNVCSCSSNLWEHENEPTGNDGLCTEKWNLGNQGITCVELTGQFKRNLDIADGTDDKLWCDFAFDYIETEVKIQMGQQNAADPAAVRFSQNVDFNLFYPQDNATGLYLSAFAAVAGILATLF